MNVRTRNIELDLWPFWDQPASPSCEHTVLIVANFSCQAVFSAYMIRSIGYEAIGCMNANDASRLVVSVRPELIIVGATLDGDEDGRSFAYLAELTLPESKFVVVEDEHNPSNSASQRDCPVWPLTVLYSKAEMAKRIAELIGPPAPATKFSGQRWRDYAEDLLRRKDRILAIKG